MNFEQTVNMLNALAGPYHRELTDWEVRRWVEELRSVKEPVALAAMKRIHQRDERFPSIARFLETVKSLRNAGGERWVELDGYGRVRLMDLLDELEQDRRDSEGFEPSEEERARNAQRMREIAVSLGRFGR